MSYGSNNDTPFFTRGMILGFSIIGAAVLGGFAVYPKYRVWSATMQGEAEYAQAEQNRRIAVLEAESKLEAAKSLAAAEVERAKGVAQANEIIGQSLKDNESYLRWLWIENLDKGGNSVIYIPTEAGLPILEAGRRAETPARK